MNGNGACDREFFHAACRRVHSGRTVDSLWSEVPGDERGFIMRRIGLLAALAACVALAASPASAAAPAPVGDQLSLLACLDSGSIDPQPANTAFHVLHGWGLNPGEIEDLGQYRFDLSINGEDYRGKLIVETTKDPDAPSTMSRRYLYNFPDGLSAGTYTFHAVWSVPETSPFDGIDCTLEIEFAPTILGVAHSAPASVHVDEEFAFETVVTNLGSDAATNVVVVNELPDPGEFITSDPTGTLETGGERPILTIELGTIAEGESVTVTVTWQAPPEVGPEGEMNSEVTVSADNAPSATAQLGIAILSE